MPKYLSFTKHGALIQMLHSTTRQFTTELRIKYYFPLYMQRFYKKEIQKVSLLEEIEGKIQEVLGKKAKVSVVTNYRKTSISTQKTRRTENNIKIKIKFNQFLDDRDLKSITQKTKAVVNSIKKEHKIEKNEKIDSSIISIGTRIVLNPNTKTISRSHKRGDRRDPRKLRGIPN